MNCPASDDCASCRRQHVSKFFVLGEDVLRAVLAADLQRTDKLHCPLTAVQSVATLAQA